MRTPLDPIRHDPNHSLAAHLDEAARVLRLPISESRFAWHPFGVYAIPLARRVVDGIPWSRRLHVWHPEVTPVGETSIYGVHTHSGTAKSHVLSGTLHHHLYAFRPADDANWRQCNKNGTHYAQLVAHVQGATTAGTIHTLPPNQPHGVSKPPGFAISLFEQAEEGRAEPFTTWQRLDAPAEALVVHPPLDPERVLREARLTIEAELSAPGLPLNRA